MAKSSSRSVVRLFVSAVFVGGIIVLYFASRWFARSGERTSGVMAFIRNPENHRDWVIPAGTRCGQSPFSMPTDGFIGFIWEDSFRPGHHHQGLDIFGGTQPGITPVYAAYSGYLTRLGDWKSSLIIRIPSDPLNSNRQIWTYYTHLASPRGASYIVADFPPGTAEVYVEEGTLLGYQGNYSGDPNNPTGVHLHFSIVKDNGNGTFMNELEIKNTLDPSPYFGMLLNAQTNPGGIPVCASATGGALP